MTRKIIAAAMLALTIGSLASTAASAQSNREVEIAGLHQLCNQGNRQSCVRFGMLLQQNRDQMGNWRRTHPDWFWYEH